LWQKQDVLFVVTFSTTNFAKSAVGVLYVAMSTSTASTVAYRWDSFTPLDMEMEPHIGIQTSSMDMETTILSSGKRRTTDHLIIRAGSVPRTTNNRMELLAVIHGLEALDRPSRVRVVTDSGRRPWGRPC
jgi:hypothetical protein